MKRTELKLIKPNQTELNYHRTEPDRAETNRTDPNWTVTEPNQTELNRTATGTEPDRTEANQIDRIAKQNNKKRQEENFGLQNRAKKSRPLESRGTPTGNTKYCWKTVSK